MGPHCGGVRKRLLGNEKVISGDVRKTGNVRKPGGNPSAFDFPHRFSPFLFPFPVYLFLFPGPVYLRALAFIIYPWVVLRGLPPLTSLPWLASPPGRLSAHQRANRLSYGGGEAAREAPLALVGHGSSCPPTLTTCPNMTDVPEHAYPSPAA